MTRFLVTSLDQALTAFANERAAGKPNPTFVVPQARLAEFQEYAKNSYTVQFQQKGLTGALVTRTLRGVVLLFQAAGE